MTERVAIGRDVADGDHAQPVDAPRHETEQRSQETAAATVDPNVLLQAKLTVGPAHDPYEREADDVAARVVRSLQSARAANAGPIDSGNGDETGSDSGDDEFVGGRIRRSTSGARRAIEPVASSRVQRKAGVQPVSRATDHAAPPGAARAVSRIQRSAAIGLGGGDLDGDTERILRRSRSGGRPLPDAARTKMESAFGADFSGIRVHAGATSTELNDRIQAKAFTTGSDIYFRDRLPDVESSGGQELLAHELTHTIQQGAAGVQDDRVKRKIALPVMPEIQRDAVDGSGLAGGGKAAAAEPNVAKLHLYVDIEAQNLGISELKNGSVGHTWIALEYVDPAKVPATVHADHQALLQAGGKYSDPMGFWPDIQNDVYYSTNPFSSYVQGWMRHPDRAHEGAEKGVQTWDLTQSELDAVIAYAESKRGQKYSVYFFNCTTFGVEAVQAAGKNAPSASTLGIMFPNALYDGIKARQDKGTGTTMTKDFDGSNERRVSGPDTNKG